MTKYKKNTILLSGFPHLLPYHGPEEHDLLAEEFLDYQTMQLPPLQSAVEFEVENLRAEMAIRKNKVKILFVHQ